MNIDKVIERINFLYHKSQCEGLTEEEKQEQKQLREHYISLMKSSLKQQLDTKVMPKPKNNTPEF
ncbi:MAG: DUF896 domain-containing protein [Clostridiaceae bacterium]